MCVPRLGRNLKASFSLLLNSELGHTRDCGVKATSSGVAVTLSLTSGAYWWNTNIISPAEGRGLMATSRWQLIPCLFLFTYVFLATALLAHSFL